MRRRYEEPHPLFWYLAILVIFGSMLISALTIGKKHTTVYVERDGHRIECSKIGHDTWECP